MIARFLAALDQLVRAFRAAHAWFSPRRRKRLYKVANLALLAFIAQGLLTDDQARAWLVVLNALLGMADANVDVPAAEPYPDDESEDEWPALNDEEH